MKILRDKFYMLKMQYKWVKKHRRPLTYLEFAADTIEGFDPFSAYCMIILFGVFWIPMLITFNLYFFAYLPVKSFIIYGSKTADKMRAREKESNSL